MAVRRLEEPARDLRDGDASRLPGLLLGLGLGGFIDGIALHQILQRHTTCSATPPTIR